MKALHRFFISILMFFYPLFSWGTLGEAVDPKLASVPSSHLSQKMGAGEKYSVYEYQQNGNTVKEFSSLQGVVFAVSWQGISKPDLEALFGTYFSEYKDAFEKNPRQYGAKTVSLKTTKMVIRRAGRMRDQRGFVYVPSLVPDGVNIESLQ